MTTTYTYSDELISDLHKDALGFRPSSRFFEEWKTYSPAEKQDEWDYLCRLSEESAAREKEAAAQAVAEFDRWIKTEMHYALDEETALRWMTSEERDNGWMEHSQDADHWVWKQGFLFTDRGREVAKMLKKIWKMEY